MMTTWRTVRGVVTPGHQVASGLGGDRRFPGGTLAWQLPHFAERGLDLSWCFRGTLNISIAPLTFEVVQAAHTFRNVRWSPTESAEDFSFFDCRIQGERGLIYYPHPDTKPEHFQPPDVLEVLTVKLPGLSYGDSVSLDLPTEQLLVPG